MSTNDTNYAGLRVTEVRNRQDLVRRGQRLEHFTVVWNAIEAVVSIMAGLIAGSVALVGFGLDSVIEVVSGAALLWRLHHDLNPTRRERVKQTTVKIVGWCFIVLLLSGAEPCTPIPGRRTSVHIFPQPYWGVGPECRLRLWWADPVAGLVMVPIIAREASMLKGESCGDSCGCR